MSKDIKKDRQRPASAQVLPNYTQKFSQQSQNQKSVYERDQLIKHVYIRSKSAKLNRVQSASRQGEGFNDTERVKKIIKKPKQQMAQEIVNLKLKINGLTQDLNHQRGKTEEMRKRYNKFAKVLNVEFQNERVWNAGVINAHKVEGIRSMYDRLKEQYERMRIHYLDLLRSSKITKQLEYVQYIETLQTEIKGLYSRFGLIEQNIVNLVKNTKKDEEVTIKGYILGENERQYNRLEEKYTKTKAKLQMKNEIIKDREKKIVFLDRYVKQLQNKLREESKNTHQKEKQLQSLQSKCETMVRQNQREKINFTGQMQELQRTIQSQRQEFEKQKQQIIREKDQKLLDILQKNNYFQNTINQLRKANNSMAEEYLKLKTTSFKFNDQPDVTQQERFTLPTETTKTEQKKKDVEKKTQYSSQKRVIQITDKPCNKNAVKKRRVQHQQIIEIANLMRYKVIGKGVTIEQIKQLFVSKSTDKKQQLWKEQYINMKEMKTILLSEPFTISNEQAQLVARYLIEDVKDQFVYVDQNNENYREVVKSIVRTLLGQYPLINQKNKEEINRFLSQFGNNIQGILKGISVEGKITKRKFLDAMKGLGAEFCEQVIEFLIGKMAQKAEDLNSLAYEEIFTLSSNS